MKKILDINIIQCKKWDNYRHIELNETNTIDTKKPQLIFNINKKGESIVDSLHNKVAFDTLKDFKSEKCYYNLSKYYIKAIEYIPEIFGINNTYCIPEFLETDDIEACNWSICYNHLFTESKRNVVKDNWHTYYKLGERVDDYWYKDYVDNVQQRVQEEKAFPDNALLTAENFVKYIGFYDTLTKSNLYVPLHNTTTMVLYKYLHKNKNNKINLMRKD